MVEIGKSYCFTNLSTRKIIDKTTITTTRTSIITPLHTISSPTADNTETPPPALHTITTSNAGAAINLKKQ